MSAPSACTFARAIEPLANGAQDAPVRLVVDEEVDVAGPDARARERLLGDLGETLDGVAEGLAALHLELGLVAGREDQVRSAAVGT
jgi:hypothetical protein